MKFNLRKNTHIRFEPEVDGGTTYAFQHRKGLLIIGRKKMYSVLSALREKDQELDLLRDMFIVKSGATEEAYSDEKELMIDLMKLVNADVIQVVETQDAEY